MNRVAQWENGRRRRGAAAVLVILVLPVLIGFAALAIDVGYVCNLAGSSQNTADAGSLGGAYVLQEGQAMSALDAALEVIARNQQQQGFLSLEDQTVELGAWDSVNRVFTALDPADWETGAFAARVVARRNNAPLFFAAVFIQTEIDVEREAVAVGSRTCGGIWGLEGVRINGSVRTDSYDSTEGGYSFLTANADGDICSGRDIDIMGSGEVNGDIMTGFGYSANIAGAAATITGITTSSLDGATAPEVELGDAESDNDNATIGLTDEGRDPFSSGWNLAMNSDDNLTLISGTYFFESITLRAGATLTVTGPTTIYVAGDVDATGNGISNVTEDPANLTLLVAGSSVILNGSSAFYGSVLAPNAEVTLSGSSDMYGAVIGGTVVMRGDFEFHVDESLAIVEAMQAPPPMLVK